MVNKVNGDMTPNSTPDDIKYGWELEEEENSIQDILYGVDTLGTPLVQDLKDKIVIARTLQRLPKEIRDKILSEVLFILMGAVGTACNLMFFTI